MLGRGNDGGIAAHGAGHPGVVLNAAFAVRAHSVGIPVLELAHQGGQVVIQAVRVVGGHNELAGHRGVAAFSAFGRFFSKQNLCTVLVRSDRRVRAGTAVTQNDYVILRVPRDGVFRFALLQFQTGGSNGNPRCANGCALQERTAGNVFLHGKYSSLCIAGPSGFFLYFYYIQIGLAFTEGILYKGEKGNLLP